MSGANQRLVLVALDLSEVQQELVYDCLTSWADNDLLGHVRVVDLSTSLVAEIPWPTLNPEERGVLPIETAFDARPWQEVVVISTRSTALGYVSEERVEAEGRLRDRVLLAYPIGSATKTYFYTLTVLPEKGTFGNDQLPFGFTLNFLHEPKNFVDKQLALRPLGSDVESTVAFTSLVCAGAFACQSSLPLPDVHDTSITDDRPTRMVRALGRAASAGYFLDNGIRKILSPDSGFSIASSANIKVIDDNVALLSRFTNELIDVGRFGYQHINIAKPEHIRPTGFWRAIRIFFDGFGGYLMKAVKRTVDDAVMDRAKPFLDAFQGVLFGENSRIIIKDSHLDSPEEITTELQRRLEQVRSIKGVELMSNVLVPDRVQWETLVDSCLGLLDGSPLPSGMESLDQVGVRTVFALPNVVGPPPLIADFWVNRKSLERLSLSVTFERIDLLDVRSVERFRTALTDSRMRDLFSKSDPDSEVEVADEEPDLIVGSLKAAIKSKSSSRSNPSNSLPVESSSEMLLRLDESLRVLSRDYSNSVLVRVSQAISQGLETAREENKFEEIQKRANTKVENPKRESRFKKVVIGSLLGLGVASLLKFALAAIGFAIGFVFVFAIWFFGFAVALVRRVVSLAIQLRKDEFARDQEWSELSLMIARTLRAITEASRLSTLQDQFSDWSRVIREVTHSPFGRLSDVEGSLDSLLEMPRPPQFATAKLLQNNEQALQTQREIWGRVMYVGYLRDMYKSIKSRWFEHYQMTVSDGVVAPEADTGSRRQIAGLTKADGSKVLNPRSDFAEEVCAPTLRSSYTAGVMGSVIKHFETRLISDVFSKTETRATATQAFDHFRPRDFLYSSMVDRDDTVGIDFTPSLFTVESGRMVANVERRISSRLDESLGAFPLGLGRPMILMTWALDVGFRVELSQMVGFADVRRASPTEPSNGPARRA